MSWFDDKELSLGADAIGWNSLKKKKNDNTLLLNYGTLGCLDDQNLSMDLDCELLHRCVLSSV